jgi:hypothetical protein
MMLFFYNTELTLAREAVYNCAQDTSLDSLRSTFACCSHVQKPPNEREKKVCINFSFVAVTTLIRRVNAIQTDFTSFLKATIKTRDCPAEAEKKPTNAHNNVHDISDITS